MIGAEESREVRDGIVKVFEDEGYGERCSLGLGSKIEGYGGEIALGSLVVWQLSRLSNALSLSQRLLKWIEMTIFRATRSRTRTEDQSIAQSFKVTDQS